MDKGLLTQALVKYFLGVILLGTLVFLPAWSLHYWQGWLLMGILFVPMFVAGLVMLAKNPDLLRKRLNAKEQEAWKARIASIPEYSCVVFLEDKVDKRKKSLIDAVSQNGEVFEFMIQSEEDLSNWIRKQLSSANISISPDCVSSLISRVDSSMRMLRNEVLKIMLYCENKGVTKVDMPLLDKLSIPDVHASVFKMTDAIGMKDAGSALLILNDLILLKEPVPKIRLMLARHFRQLICAKELGDANAVINELKVRPFVARNLITQARGFTIEQLERIYGLCFDSDQWVKTGRMEDRTSLDVLLSAAGKI